jgi:hypothetical protein
MTDDWEAQYDGIGAHTDFYLHSLGEYVEVLRRPVGGVPRGLRPCGLRPSAGSIDVLKAALGLGPRSRVGDELSLGGAELRLDRVGGRLPERLSSSACAVPARSTASTAATPSAAPWMRRTTCSSRRSSAEATAAWQAWLERRLRLTACPRSGPCPQLSAAGYRFRARRGATRWPAASGCLVRLSHLARLAPRAPSRRPAGWSRARPGSSRRSAGRRRRSRSARGPGRRSAPHASRRASASHTSPLFG